MSQSMQYIIPFVTAITLISLVLGMFVLFQTNPSIATFITRQWAIVTMVFLIITLLLALYASRSRTLDLQLQHPMKNPNLPTLYEVHVTEIHPDSKKWKFDTSFTDDKNYIKDVATNNISLVLANGTFYKPTYASQDTLITNPISVANTSDLHTSSSFEKTLIQLPAVLHVLGWRGQ